MKNNKNVFRGVTALIISQVVVKIFGLLYKLYLANKQGFGDEGNAVYNSGYQIYALLLTISSIGVPNAVAKIIAENRNNKYKTAEILKGALALFSCIGIIGSVMLAVFSKYVSYKLLDIPEAQQSIIALSPAIFNVCILSVYRGYYNGISRVDITAKSQTIEQILKTIFTVALVEISYVITLSNTTAMAAFANFATTLATLGSFIYLCKKSRIRDVKSRLNLKNMVKILYISVPISLSSILASLNKNIDSVTVVRFLKKYIGEQNAKVQYGILSGKIEVLSSVPVSFIIAIATTIIPTVAGLMHEKNNIKINELTNKYMKYTILLVIPCCFCIMIFSNQILEFLFGSSNGNILLKIGAMSIVFVSLEQIVNAVLQGIGKIFVPAIALSMGVITKIILNFKFLSINPNFYWYGGIIGSCIATLCCHIVAFSISFFVLKKTLKIKFEILNFLLKPIIASCIMAMCLYYTYFLLKGIIQEKLAIILAGTVAITVYTISIFLFNILSKDELSSIPILNKVKYIGKIKKIRKNKEKRRILYKFGE